MSSKEKRQSVYWQLIRGNRAFRHLWAGQIISLTGDWFNLIASASLIAVLTQSGTAVGGLFVVRMLAPFLVSPIAGVVADRYNRRAIVITTDVLALLRRSGLRIGTGAAARLADLPVDRYPKRVAGFLLPPHGIPSCRISRQRMSSESPMHSQPRPGQ